LSEELLLEFAGDYYNDELQITCTVTVKEGQLFIRTPSLALFSHGIDGENPLRHAEGDKFYMGQSHLIFSRDMQSRIADFTFIASFYPIHEERLKFTKI